jgi:hypothetical protein
MASLRDSRVIVARQLLSAFQGSPERMSNDIVREGGRGSAMDPKNAKDAASRKVVSERLRRFFAALTTQLATGTVEIWSKVERRLADKRSDDKRSDVVSAGENPSSPGERRRQPARQQPIQQQQMKAQDEK